MRGERYRTSTISKLNFFRQIRKKINHLDIPKVYIVDKIRRQTIFYTIDTRPDHRTNAPVNEIDEKPESAGK